MAENRKKPVESHFGKQSLITVENGKRLVMESVERIVFCDSERMVLESGFSVEILGRRLVLEELGNDNMAVKGWIESIRFEEKRP